MQLIYPTIMRHLPEDNFIFAVLEKDTESFYEAIMEHFFDIRFFYRDSINSIEYDFEDNANWNIFKGLDVVYLSQHYINKHSSFDYIKSLIISLLNDDYYLLVPIDKYYIEEYKTDQHTSHTLMIGGYHQNHNMFICQDYFTGIYESKIIPVKNVIKGICNYHKTNYINSLGQSNITGVVGLKKKDNYNYSFNLSLF